MHRVVITGLGIISPIGNSATEVEASLRAGRSGIIAAPDYTERGFRSQVKGSRSSASKTTSTSATCASWGRGPRTTSLR